MDVWRSVTMNHEKLFMECKSGIEMKMASSWRKKKER